MSTLIPCTYCSIGQRIGKCFANHSSSSSHLIITPGEQAKESSELFTEKTIELVGGMKLNTNEEVILSIIHRKDELTVTAVQSIKVNIIVETFRKEDETIKLMRQKSHDSRRHIENDGIHLSNFGITQTVKIFREFLNNN